MLADATAPLLWTLILGLSTYGWGIWLKDLTGRDLPGLLPCITGLAWMILIGGIANLVHAATILSLSAILLTGLVAWAIRMVELWRLHSTRDARVVASFGRALLPFATAIVLCALSAAFVASPTIYNIHDDFEKYLRYPVRMLACGTVRSSPFDAIGTESLGGLAFIQAYATGYLSVFYANCADAVFGLFLATAAAASIACRDQPRPLQANLASLAVFLVNPLCVNVSAIYVTAAITALVLFLSLTESKPARGTIILLGFGYAALVALKTTSLPFVAVHLLLHSITVPGRPADRILYGLRVASIVALALAPWILVHYGTAYSIASVIDAVTDNIASPANAGRLINPFASLPLLYGLGNTVLNYSLLCFAATAHLAWHHYMTPRVAVNHATVIRWSAIPLFYFGLVVFAEWSTGRSHALRYAAPSIIGGIAALVGLVASMPRSAQRSSRVGTWLTRTAFIAALCPFVLPLLRREAFAWEKGTKIQIPWYVAERAAQNFCRFVQSPDALAKIDQVQRSIPAGAVVALWTQFSFLFDLERSQIVDIDPAGLLSPGALAEFKRTGSYVEALAQTGAQFLIMQHADGGRTPEAIKATAEFSPPREKAGCYALLTLLHEIELLEKSGAVVYQDGLVTILKLPVVESAGLLARSGQTVADF